MTRHLAAINAHLSMGEGGGITAFLGALISALGQLQDSEDSYLLVGHAANRDWLQSIKGENQELVLMPDKPISGLARALQPARRALRPLKRYLLERAALDWRRPGTVVPHSNGFWESLPAHCIHFPNQQYYICDRPTIYNPHDLQHRHLPEFFTRQEFAIKETKIRTGCESAQAVVCASQWVKQDIVRHYRTEPDRIQVIPWAAPTVYHPGLEPAAFEAFKERVQLPDRYILYPAVTWPHKNHMRLFSALARLRDRHDLVVPLLCTGGAHRRNQRELERQVRRLGLAGQVRFLGFLANEELRAVYRHCVAVVVPTLFEAASGPVFEAWQEGRPVACSNVTSLPEQASDAAIVFDPLSEEAIADAVRALWCDDALATDLAKRGRRRLQDFSWERTAQAYRAVYRRVGGQELSEEDERVLNWDWMRDGTGVPDG